MYRKCIQCIQNVCKNVYKMYAMYTKSIQKKLYNVPPGVATKIASGHSGHIAEIAESHM